MPFTFKLAKRMAIAWRRRPPLLLLAVAFLPHLPLEIRLMLLTFWRAVSLTPFWSDIGDRRRCQLPTAILVLRFAILAIPKVAPSVPQKRPSWQTLGGAFSQRRVS